MASKKYFNTTSLKPMCSVLSVFGMAVNFDSKNIKNRQRKMKLFHFYSLIILLPISTIIATISQINFYLNMRLDLIITDLSITVLLIIYTFSTLTQTFNNNYLWMEFFQELKSVDIKLSLAENTNRTLIWIELIFSQIVYVFLFSFQFFIWENMETITYIQLLPYKMSVYSVFSSCNLICNFAKLLNERLVLLRKNTNDVCVLSFHYHKKLSTIISCYKNMKRIVDLFNKIFGKRIFITIALILLYILECMGLLLTFPIGELYVINDLNAPYFIAFTFIWMVKFK